MTELLPFPPFPTDSPRPQPPDAEARRHALDIRRSFIVEAPAGSGKTGLLIQRLLKLLADESVTSPEQVLAITFTNKATAEMRDRVLAHLEAAHLEAARLDSSALHTSGSSEFDRQTRALARAVLERDRQLGWALLQHPHRLNIRTIDSVCALIARTLPVLSGSGGRLTPTPDAGPLHGEAARRTILLLGGSDADFNEALRNLLLHRDGNLAEFESLLADMLSLRDQWGDLIPLNISGLDDAWLDANVLPRFNRALERAICAVLTRLAQIFPTGVLADLTSLAAELGELDGRAGNPSPIAICSGCDRPPQAIAAHLNPWRALIHLLLKPSKPRDWRKSVGRSVVKFEIEKRHEAMLKNIIARLSCIPDLMQTLLEVDSLPEPQYPGDQWKVAKSLFRVLSRALVELQLVFAAHNQCDFTELSLLARHALDADSGPEDLAAGLGARLQHLLVDEMQDTSTSQYKLIETLTGSWDGHSQTVFLVGDPRQSIYLFRQARVERFIQAMRTQRLGEIILTPLRLTANFRSQHSLVEQFNHDFGLIFPHSALPEADPLDLPYTSAESTLPASSHARGAVWHANPLPASTAPGAPEPALSRSKGLDSQTWDRASPASASRKHHAGEILRIAHEWLAKPLPANRTEPWRIAVLVRNRNHLAEIVAEFDSEALDRIPYRAVEITALNQRQEILDLTALTRALLHPADRVATLAVLRAPWCGLSLADLHLLAGADDAGFKNHSIQRLMDERGHLLPDDSCRRMARAWTVLREAAAKRARLTTAQLVERAWRSLGGDAWLDDTQLTNARRFFQLLDTLETTGIGVDSSLLHQRLEKLYAEPEPVAPETPFVELLTIHKAKGLEWDVVLVPALERQAAPDPSRLLTWSEIDSSDLPDAADEDVAHFMLAPIAGRGEPSKRLNRWLNGIERARDAAERKRLFYVACTRAREELHLFAAPQLNAGGEINPRHDSLLKAAWPAAKRHFTPNLLHDAATAGPAQPLTFAIAASAPAHHATLQRLPLTFDPSARFIAARDNKLPYGDPESAISSSQTQFSRPEGSFAARSFGNAVHACLEILSSRITEGETPAALLAELPSWMPRIAAILRADGLPRSTVDTLARDTRAALENTLRDPDGLWLLAPHPGAASEFALTALPEPNDLPGQSSVQTGVRPTSVRVDRIFNAGPHPHAPGEDYLWIVDYKTTTHGPTGLQDFLAAQRATYSPQLENYARILAPARSKSQHHIRLALYFPTIPRLIYWQTAPAAN